MTPGTPPMRETERHALAQIVLFDGFDPLDVVAPL